MSHVVECKAGASGEEGRSTKRRRKVLNHLPLVQGSAVYSKRPLENTNGQVGGSSGSLRQRTEY